MDIINFLKENYPIFLLFIIGTILVWIVIWRMTKEDKTESKDPYKDDFDPTRHI